MRNVASLCSQSIAVALLIAHALSAIDASAQTTFPEPAKEAPVAIPPPPSVDDPMLAPMPPAGHTISTWEQAIALVRANSTELRIQYNQVLAAEAQSRSALAAALPTINLNANASHQLVTNPAPSRTVQLQIPGAPTFVLPAGQTRVPTPNISSLNASLIQPMLALATWHSIGTARVGEDVARLSLEDTKRTIALNVAGALVGAITSERIAELNRIGLQSSLERLALTIRRRDLGAANGLDVVRAQQDVETARATLVTGDESLRQARESLGLALGIAGPVGVSRETKIDGLEASASRACKPTANLDERADIAAQKKRIEVAGRSVDNVKLQFLPTINAQSTVSTSSVDQSPAPQVTWNIQGVLSWNVWDGGARYGALRNTRAQADSAVQTLEAQRRAATVQITQARRAVEVAEQSRKVASDARALSAELDRLTRAGYQEGRGTSLELVVAAAALRQAEVALALREFEVVRARVLAILALATCPW
jgi:outer membrane protein, multidrug efflux system